MTIIGNGSNLLVRDGGIRGLVLRISGGLNAIAEWMFPNTWAGPPMRRVVYCAIGACGAMRSGAKLA